MRSSAPGGHPADSPLSPATSPGLVQAGVLTHTHDGSTHSHVVGRLVPLGPRRNLHLQGTLLPSGEVRDVWISDGIMQYSPVPDAETIARGVWIMPGFVDAHSHIGLGSAGAVDEPTAEQQAIDDRNAGTLLIRDAGSPVDTHWIDEREDLPEIIRAGRHIARPRRYIRNYADEVEPEDLVETVERQVERGDGWVKLVGDWIDREEGDLDPLWPVEIASEAIERAHQMGARVTAHCFGEESAAELVRAGIDGIEHGTGLDDDTIQLMADRQVSLVPTLVNLENFPGIADQAQPKFPRYAAHMRDLHRRRFETIGKAFDAGVPIYAGTDAGGVVPHGIIGREVELLGRIGGPEFALGAASWQARDWLGRPCLEEDAPADLVVFAEDPRRNLGIARHPLFVILKGRIMVQADDQGE